MAFDTEKLNIDFRQLMKIPVYNRYTMAQSGLLTDIMSMMTPTQVSSLFPTYYKQGLPDISGFNIATTRMTRESAGGGYGTGGRYGGGAGAGGGYGAGGGRTSTAVSTPELTTDQMKKKLLEKGIDVDKTYTKISGGISEEDPQVKFLKGMSAQKLNSLGIQTQKDDAGKTIYALKPVDAETMSDDEVLKAMAESSGKVIPGNIRDDSESLSYYDRMYNALFKAAVEKRISNPEIIARLGASQTALETGYGKSMVGNNAFGIKANKGGPSVEATTQEYINGKYVTIKDKFRQYASPEESAADYIDFLKENKRYKEVLAATNIQEAIVAQGLTGYATDPNYANKLYSINESMSKGASSAVVNKDISEILANSSPEEIQKFRQDLINTQKKAQFDNYIKEMYGQNAIDNSYAAIDKEFKFTDKLGQMTPNPRQYEDIYGKSEPGEFNYSLSPEGIQRLGLSDESGRLTPTSIKKNLVEIETNNGVKVKVHKSVAENTKAFLNQLEARGYPLRQADTGGYAWRNKAKSSGLSTHSTGTSLDLNWNSNWGEFGAAGNIDLPPEVEKLANYYGFSWGAKFGDPMHFEVMSPELHQKRLEQLQSEGYIEKVEKETTSVTLASEDQILAPTTADPNDLPVPIDPQPTGTPPVKPAQTTEPVSTVNPNLTPSGPDTGGVVVPVEPQDKNYKAGTSNAGYAEEVSMINNKTGEHMGNVSSGEMVGITRDDKLSVASETRTIASEVLPKTNMDMSAAAVSPQQVALSPEQTVKQRSIQHTPNNLDPMRLTADKSFVPSPSFDRSMNRVVQSGNKYNSRGVPWSNV